MSLSKFFGIFSELNNISSMVSLRYFIVTAAIVIIYLSGWVISRVFKNKAQNSAKTMEREYTKSEEAGSNDEISIPQEKPVAKQKITNMFQTKEELPLSNVDQMIKKQQLMESAKEENFQKIADLESSLKQLRTKNYELNESSIKLKEKLKELESANRDKIMKLENENKETLKKLAHSNEQREAIQKELSHANKQFEISKNQINSLSQESDLIVQQLHQVQEELQHYYSLSENQLILLQKHEHNQARVQSLISSYRKLQK